MRTPRETRNANFCGGQVEWREQTLHCGKVADTNSETLAVSDSPIMRGQIVDGDKVHVVEVYARSGLFRVKLRIHIDGKKVAGDDF